MENYKSIRWEMAEILAVERFCSAAWNTAVLQGRCFVSGHDPFPQESDHAKFQQKRLRNGWVIKTVPKKDKFILLLLFFILPSDNRTIANARFSFSLALAGDGKNFECSGPYLKPWKFQLFLLYYIEHFQPMVINQDGPYLLHLK